MNGTPSDDRLSAWLDDELPLAERAEIEQQLAESPVMRQEVDELRQVSELVRGLPTAKAPEELQPAIMRSIERDTLLAGESLNAAPGARSGAPSPRQNPKIVLTAVASLAIAAFIMLLNGGPEPDPVDEKPIVQGSVPPAPPLANHPQMDDDQKPEDDEDAPQGVEPTPAPEQQ